MPSAPLLSFSSKKADRAPLPTIAIDGTVYTLRPYEQLSFAQRMAVSKADVRVRLLNPKIDDLTCTAEEEAEYQRLMAQMARLAVTAPGDVVDSLQPEEHMVIASAAFFGFRPESTQAPAGRPATKTKRTTTKTGARLSRG